MFLCDCVAMLMNLICLAIFVAPSVLPAMLKENPIYSCSLSEYSCSDGTCISADLICDGVKNCADGSDEMNCETASIFPFGDTILNRSKRQSTCRKNQWKCRDGTCIPFDGKCDGVVDCPDASDETHPLCRNTQCQSNWFRCTYGACVDGTAPCNGIQECADNSDELLPKCRNETEEIRGQFKCVDGSTITADKHCDGVNDCADGSDETVRACAAKTCPSYLFQCAYGACVDSGSNCNGVQECADGSDEAAELCGKPITIKPASGSCVLPQYPEHGSYVTDIQGAQPGQGYQLVNLNVTCTRGYGIVGSASTYCYNGVWPGGMPKCVRMCQLNPHPSVEYRCQVSGAIDGSRPCNMFEPVGTVVNPSCRLPNYYSPTTLTFMRCIDGYWDYVARCSPGLAKNGTNITVLIKDTVEVTYGTFQYVVPMNYSGIGVESNSGFNNSGIFNNGDKNQGQSKVPNNNNIGTFGNKNKKKNPYFQHVNSSQIGISNKPVYHYDQFVPITDDNISNDDNSENTSNSLEYDIDKRFGDVTVDKTSANKMQININITNSSVYVNNEDRDRIVFLD